MAEKSRPTGFPVGEKPELTAAGTVADSHGVPFRSRFLNRLFIRGLRRSLSARAVTEPSRGKCNVFQAESPTGRGNGPGKPDGKFGLFSDFMLSFAYGKSDGNAGPGKDRRRLYISVYQPFVGSRRTLRVFSPGLHRLAPDSISTKRTPGRSARRHRGADSGKLPPNRFSIPKYIIRYKVNVYDFTLYCMHS